MGDERRLEPFGELIMQAPAFTIFLIPLRLVSRNLWFVRRLHQNWELELFGPPDALAPRNDHEVGHVDAVIMENLLRDALMLAKGKTGRAAAGKWEALHFEK